ncbi:MAG: methyltransferase domain-containing protein [Thermoanaerobaculia bacterium]|nr:methyltransferase domain-containing protein [Thermoanaerobaculia bacterium]
MQQDVSDAIERERLKFILDHQAHLERYLSPIADPEGKSVLVVGAGAGTEILWCLERGAASVTGIDLMPQSNHALEQALVQRSVSGDYRVLEMGVEEAGSLGQTFDLVLSNNVFEHLSDVPEALRVCRKLTRPGSGRVAIFSSPLFYSSPGSHLDHLPWEHLWGDPDRLRDRLLAEGGLPEYHALRRADLDGFFQEIGLNRLTLNGLLDAVRETGLLILDFGIVKDRHAAHLQEYLPKLEPVCTEMGISVTDLAVEGFWLEMAVPAEAPADALASLMEARGLGPDLRALVSEVTAARARAEQLEDLLARVEKSPSLRIGRMVTAPFRKLRSLL